VGCSKSGVYHDHGSSAVRRIRPEDLVLFTDELAAQAAGFRPAAEATPVP
jgi:methylphosphotriester-DNA--protein-cysteine methyltransferase